MRPSDSLISFGEKLRSPLASRLPRRGRLFFALRPAARASAYELRVGDSCPAPRVAGCFRGETRASQVPGHRPLPACQGRTPRRMQPPLAYCPSARTLARLRIAGRVAAPVARLAPGWGGYPFAGRDSHPLDDIPNFMNSSHDSLLSDQNFLVALKRSGPLQSNSINMMCDLGQSGGAWGPASHSALRARDFWRPDGWPRDCKLDTP
jgi:hypothetical protein